MCLKIEIIDTIMVPQLCSDYQMASDPDLNVLEEDIKYNITLKEAIKVILQYYLIEEEYKELEKRDFKPT